MSTLMSLAVQVWVSNCGAAPVDPAIPWNTAFELDAPENTTLAVVSMYEPATASKRTVGFVFNFSTTPALTMRGWFAAVACTRLAALPDWSYQVLT